MGETMSWGTEKKYYSGVFVPHPVANKLQDVVDEWIWYTGTDQIHDDSEVMFRCGECRFGLHAQTNRAKLGHLVTMHGYNMNGEQRGNSTEEA